MRLNLIGGFLGSGKTTAIANAAKKLIADDLKVGIITNDQGKYLVDSHFFDASKIPSAEVLSGCFCCNYDSFDERIHQLQAQYHPEVIFAESVGSCADLVATVVKPLISMREKDDLDVSLSVFVDSRLLLAHLSGKRLPFGEDICYIFANQIEEADILVVNKVDLLKDLQINQLKEKVKYRYASKIILFQNSLNNKDICKWLQVVRDFKKETERSVLDIDYSVYGAGEAQLAWLDEELEIISEQPVESQKLNDLIYGIHEAIQRRQLAIGHLKFLITANGKAQKMSFTALSDDANKRILFDSPVKAFNILINARIETEPAIIRDIIDEVLTRWKAANDITVNIKWEDAFKPGFPHPTHRMQ